VRNIKGCSSALQSLKLARLVGLKSELKPAFVLDRYYVALLRYYVALLRHYVMRTKLVVLRENGRLSNIAGLVMEYVIYVSCLT
jgi:hypothetical protein